jgi:hypothetical protein
MKMGTTNSAKKTTDTIDIKNYPGKIARRDDKAWIKVCPLCMSPRITALTNISGTVIHEQWLCLECNYVGVAIEVKAEDLARFQIEQLKIKLNRNRKKSI